MQTAVKVKGASFIYEEASPEALFTPEDFTAEHKMMAQTAKAFAEREADPQREAVEAQDFDATVKLLHKAGELGLLAHSIPEAYGGLGLDKISKGIVGEAIGRTGSYGVAHSNHTCIATLPITYFGTEEQKQRYLPKLASGEYIGAYCLTEPASGSDALAAKTTAVLNEEGTHYILNGSKLYITNAAFSDTFIIYAKIDGEHFSAFIAEKDFPGLSLGPEEKKMGIKGSSTRTVLLEDCLVPKENLLGEPGKGHVIALNVLNLGRFNLGSACVGASKHALKLALEFTKNRVQFARSIAEFPAVKEKLALMASRIFAAESIQYRTAGLLEDALGSLYESTDHKAIARNMMEYASECSICKVFGSETLDYCADEALQLHGGAGFIQEYPIEQVYRDSRINRIFEGTNEINRLLLPVHFLRKASKGEVEFEPLVKSAYQAIQETPEQPAGKADWGRQVMQVLRNTLLISFGAAYEVYGGKLAEEQETLMKLSDLASALFSAESAILRAWKAGGKKSELMTALSETAAEEALYEGEKLAKQLIGQLIHDDRRDLLLTAVSRRFMKLGTSTRVERNRSIAEAMLEKGAYTIS
ncbi:acyl-CoA dehydrogenase [Bacillus mangrovi]|uniref:Acyl-CoA dehydrogenase n=1 Tax=Metabacillus mangrovi TaxID=1491830 RepID=A0A7X2S8U4_9BACI|nr:acyl-CoA dehydrogenase family protein [Metabacillus mangrovi]MTH55331.1 acyl-CoA dehydrogenase [Metabacillus mangrovi]